MTTLGLRSALIFSLLRSRRASFRQVRDGRFHCGLQFSLLPEPHRASLHPAALSTHPAKRRWRLLSKATEFHECGGKAAPSSARGVRLGLALSLEDPPISCLCRRFQGDDLEC